MFKIKLLTILIILGAFAHGRPLLAASETLTVAGGCFWCVESDFESVPGVIEAISGFTGGTAKNPSYRQVTSGGTGHYEAVQITFDTSKVSAARLLELFFRSIAPTDAGGQFCDRGPTYRTAVFANSPAQKSAAETARADAQTELGKPIVTPILAAGDFYPAEAKHQDYYKGTRLILTRFGPKRQSEAYKRYRKACRRDQRVQELWGAAAPFAAGH